MIEKQEKPHVHVTSNVQSRCTRMHKENECAHRSSQSVRVAAANRMEDEKLIDSAVQDYQCISNAKKIQDKKDSIHMYMIKRNFGTVLQNLSARIL